ncbi:hypothetical protein ACP4OV_030030 [Aristida adscensionis]
MAPSKLRAALGAAKDQTSIGLARAGGADEVAADLEVAVVRATAHGECLPADERHVQDILTLTRYSRARVAACVAAVSRRLGRTRAWHVAVKALSLVHRLLADGDPAFEQEVFLATRAGRRVLDMSRFRAGDRARSRAGAGAFPAFVRAYAAYLDDRLKHRMQGRTAGVASPRKWRLDGGRDSFDGTDGVGKAWSLVPGHRPATAMTSEDLIAAAQQLKHLLNRFVACRPTGKARTNRVVCAALHGLVKESAAMYCELTEVMAALVDRFVELETPSCVLVHAMFTSLARLVEELDDIYSWCKATDVCRPSDVPDVERVKQRKLDLMDEFIRDRIESASRWSRSPSVSFSPRFTHVDKYDVEAADHPPTPKKQMVVALAQEENDAAKAAPPQSAGPIVVVDDKTADFLNLTEDASPLFEGKPAETSPEWVVFEDYPTVWDTAPPPSTSRPAAPRVELGGGFTTTLLDGMYSHGTANAAMTNAHAFGGSASSVAMRPPGANATALALPPASGASSAADAARPDPFAASLFVPPPTCVQMTDLQTRQRLLAEEQMAWQQYERQRAAFYCNNNLL